MNAKEPAFPSIDPNPPIAGHDLPMDRWKGGLSKREYLAFHLACAFASTGKQIPELAAIWDMAEKFIEAGERNPKVEGYTDPP